MEIFSYLKSQDFCSRAANVIPGGIYGHYSPAPLIPASHGSLPLTNLVLLHMRSAPIWAIVDSTATTKMGR